MIPFELLFNVIDEQYRQFSTKKSGIEREINFAKYFRTRHITAITGIRRCGKSTLLYQFSQKLDNYYYLNLDDERLINFSVNDFQTFLDVYKKKFTSRNILIDEVQNVDKWERFVRRIYDDGYKIFITGSNSRLLATEFSHHLTGRHFLLELFPFSFREYAEAKKIKTRDKIAVLQAVGKYMKDGGFPEFVHYGEPEILQRIYEDILYKDLLTRRHIKEVKPFRELAGYLNTNISKEFSYNSLAEILRFKSPMSVRNYVHFMEEAYLVFEHYKYDPSLKKQYVSNKKLYTVDNGLRNSVAFVFSEDNGRLLENLVFIELKRRGMQTYFYKGQRECDFLIKEKNKITAAIQVCYCYSEDNIRELEGLYEAYEFTKASSLVLFTLEQEGILKIKGKKVRMLPVHKWLLGEKIF